ncbi:unnamed protein product, partial [Owenia fusiformis]
VITVLPAHAYPMSIPVPVKHLAMKQGSRMRQIVQSVPMAITVIRLPRPHTCIQRSSMQGYYCGNQLPSGECDAGYNCPSGITTPDFIICPEGQYCTESTVNQIQCPIGTYSNVTGLKNDTKCFPCPGNFETEGFLKPRCDPGYYCPIGSITPRI